MQIIKMKHLKLFFFFVSAAFAFAAFNSDCTNIQWGTKTLYHLLQTDYSAQPNGYETVYINYVGRHGARHVSGIDEISNMFLLLRIAQQENALTEKGKTLKKMDSLLIIIETGNDGLISEIGKHEQESIGERMGKNYPEVFNAGNIKISTTKKERTKQSARAFIQGLKPGENILVDSIIIDQTHLAFYDDAPTYKKYEEDGSWKVLWEKIKSSQKVAKLEQELPKQFFTPDFISKMNSGQIQLPSDKDSIIYTSGSFIESFYGGCSIIPSIKLEIENAGFQTKEINFASLVSDEDLKVLDYVNTAEDFLLKGPATDPNGIQVKIAAPLLLGFLNSTEEYISSGKTIADLRFAHAETISPFAVLMGITGASEPVSTENIPDFNKAWKCENIIPLSANIQWILYYNKKKGDFLIKFLLNEKEVTINGLNDCGIPYYYRWNDVNEFYTKKLEKLGVHPGDDMQEYLLNVN